ncbi:MAG: hypothetical protein ACK5UC_19305 [Planctomycetaceae bacterium]|jgi:hypothetical protein
MKTCVEFDRRQFLAMGLALWSGSQGQAFCQPGESARSQPVLGPGPGSGRVLKIAPRDGAELQSTLWRQAETGNTLQLPAGANLILTPREERVGPHQEISRHPLLIPPGVRLDLNGATLQLELTVNCYGVRLSNDSALRNGTIQVVRSQGKGLQACWHSGVSIGAAYGDGGTPDQPGVFSTVAQWGVEDLVIEQPFPAAAMQLMSEACRGVIRRVTIADSPRALLGVGLDWGSVGPITSEDREIARMRGLWERGEIYSTHPHDIRIEAVRVGNLGRCQDGNDAGIRCSACDHITIRDLRVESAAAALAIFGGDLGYEFAREDSRDRAHQGYDVDGVRIDRAGIFGLVLNGLADNVWRARENHGYEPVRDPCRPGLDQPQLRNIDLRGVGGKSQGVYAVAVTDAHLDRIQIRGFETGVHPEDWVDGLQLTRAVLEDNQHAARIEGVRSPAQRVEITN